MSSPVAPIGNKGNSQGSEVTGGAATKKVAGQLSEVLSNSYMLYLKTQNFHWNVEGHRFVAIHTLTEEHYQEMAEAIDMIAERIRALGYYAPGSFRDFVKLSEITEAEAMPLSEQEMVDILEKDHMRLVAKLKQAIKAAEADDDTTSSDLLSERRKFHEKAAWMFRSLNKG